MAVSFTAEYLYQGSRFLTPTYEFGFTEHEDPFALVRGLYTLGVAVVAPCGVLYHICRVAIYAIESLIADTESAKTEINERFLEHLTAAGYDSIAMCEMILELATVLAVVAGFFFGEWALCIPVGCAWFSLYMQEPDWEKSIITYQYTLHPTHFVHFLSKEKNKEGLIPYNMYLSFYMWSMFEKSAVVIEGPLSNPQIQELSNIFTKPRDEMMLPIPLAMTYEMWSLFKSWNKLSPASEPRLQFLFDHKPALQAAWTSTLIDAQQLEESLRGEFISRTFAEKGKEILQNSVQT